MPHDEMCPGLDTWTLQSILREFLESVQEAMSGRGRVGKAQREGQTNCPESTAINRDFPCQIVRYIQVPHAKGTTRQCVHVSRLSVQIYV